MMPKYHNPAIEIERAASLFHIINFSFSITPSIRRIRAHHVEQLSVGVKRTKIKPKRVPRWICLRFPSRVSGYFFSSSASLVRVCETVGIKLFVQILRPPLDKLCLLAILRTASKASDENIYDERKRGKNSMFLQFSSTFRGIYWFCSITLEQTEFYRHFGNLLHSFSPIEPIRRARSKGQLLCMLIDGKMKTLSVIGAQSSFVLLTMAQAKRLPLNYYNYSLLYRADMKTH
jgi:hypothetical protein